MQERFAASRAAKQGVQSGKLGFIKGSMVANKDIDKVRMSKKLVDADIVMEMFKYMQECGTGKEQPVDNAKTAESPAKKSKTSATVTPNLTGAHGEPRQEK
jgi:hypothetical protein